MNVAIIGSFYGERFGQLISEALVNLGHETTNISAEVNFTNSRLLGDRLYSFNKTLYQEVFSKIPKIRRKKSKDIYAQIKGKSIDLVLALHDYLNEEEVSEIRRITKAPVAMWFPDAMSNFRKSTFFNSGYDAMFFSDKYIVHKFVSEFSLPTYYLPQCFSLSKHKRIDLTEEDLDIYECDITNAGNLYPSRAALYQHFTDYNFKLWGGPPAIWMNTEKLRHIIMGKIVFMEEKSKAFSAAKIVLNNLHPAVVDGVNKRTFEIPACGGFQISSLRDATNELFEVGKEIVCYKNLEDLKEKIDYYLNPKNESERKEIIDAGYNKAINHHTYEHRMKEMLELIFTNNL